MNKTQLKTWLTILIGSAKKRGATQKELETMTNAFELFMKYYPTAENVLNSKD